MFLIIFILKKEILFPLFSTTDNKYYSCVIIFFYFCKTFQNGRPISLILNLEETSIGKTSSPSIIFNSQGVIRPK
jgi:hypothetical protein